MSVPKVWRAQYSFNSAGIRTDFFSAATRLALIVDLLDRALSGDVIVLAQHGGQRQRQGQGQQQEKKQILRLRRRMTMLVYDRRW